MQPLQSCLGPEQFPSNCGRSSAVAVNFTLDLWYFGIFGTAILIIQIPMTSCHDVWGHVGGEFGGIKANDMGLAETGTNTVGC